MSSLYKICVTCFGSANSSFVGNFTGLFWINLIFLPHFFNRSLYQQGVITRIVQRGIHALSHSNATIIQSEIHPSRAIK